MKPHLDVTSKRIILAFVCGLVTPFAFSPYHIFPLVIAGIAVLIYIWMLSTPRQAGLYGYVYGLGFFGYGVSWVHISINLFGGVNIIGAYFLTFLLCAFLALFPALCGYLSRKLYSRNWPTISLIIAIPVYWTISEWIRSWIFTGFPWLNIGYTQTDTILNGYAPLLGVFGICLSVVLTSACLAGLFILDNKGRLQCLSAACLLWGIAWFCTNLEWSKPLDQTLSVALIQGAIPQDLKWDPAMREPTLDLYRDLTLTHVDSDLIIWPEAAIPAYYHQMQDYLHELSEHAKNNNYRLLTGIPVWEEDTGKFFNSIVMLGDDTEFYYKKHLVPFGEYLPLKFMLGGLVKILNIPMSDFSKGPDRAPLFDAGSYRMGLSICYEDIFGNEIIQALPDAGFLINVSNDAWFGDSAAPHQHMQMARMRALETGRYMLRATNTGVTAIIDKKGNILSRSPQFEPATLTGVVNLYSGHTPYSKYGNYPVILFCLLVLGFMGYLTNRKET